MINTLLHYKYIRLNYSYPNAIVLILFLLHSLGLARYDIQNYIVFSTLLLVSIIDIHDKIIPNKYVIFLILISIPSLNISISLDFFVAVFIILLTCIVSIMNGSIGMGDVKLFIALWLNLSSSRFIYLFFLISIILFIVSMYLLFKSKNFKIEIPLAPVITLAFILI